MHKKIILLASFSESLVNFRGKLIDDLLKDGYQVIAGAPEALSCKFLNEFCSGRFTIIDTPLQRKGLNIFADLKYILVIYKAIYKYKPTHIISYTIKPNLYSLLAAIPFRGVKKINLITGLGNQIVGKNFINKLIRFLARLAYMFSDIIIFQNSSDKSFFQKRILLNHNIANKTNLHVVDGSGVDITEFPRVIKFPDKLNVTFIGRLIEAKGIVTFLEAINYFNKKNFDIHFHIAGWFDEKCSFKELFDRTIENSNISFYGKHDDVRSLMQSSSLFVLPTFYPEGIPRTILEALSSGLPVITSNHPGCIETVKHGINGFLVDSQDCNELVKYISKFYENNNLIEIFGAESRKICEDRFDVKIINKKIMNILNA